MPAPPPGEDSEAEIEKPVRPASPVPARAPRQAQAAPRQEPKRIRDLPADVRGRLEGVRIEGHVYSSDPARRFVFVEGRTYRVGEKIGENGPVLVEITVEGAVVDFGGGTAILHANP